MISRDTFNAATAQARDFYRNFATRFLELYHPDYTDALLFAVTLTPMQLANRVAAWQTINIGTVDLDTPALIPNLDYPTPDPTIPADPVLESGFPDQAYLIPIVYGPHYTRKYNVRKSYWTGVSRRRRNL